MQFNQLATKESVAKTKLALEKNGISVHIAQTGAEAKEKVLALIPKGSEVMTMSSTTLDTIGLNKYDTVRDKLKEKRYLGSTPQYALGSAQSVTETGQLVFASNTGSQLPAYAYGANHVIWVVGTQKIVPDLDTAMKRIYEYILPKESERANKAYKITSGSFVSKLLIINKEIKLGRAIVILVNEVLGF